ncbi:MAG: biopolymer transporter ExbD, partial [Gammaproteobacteria bacterium]|nr:biopolymer transporter ExbD [Gammaproteobacteria bacterium]
PWVIRVEHNGRVALNDQQLTLQRLKERVRALLQSNPEQSFIIQPASNSVAQATVDVLDQLSAAGATRISLAR